MTEQWAYFYIGCVLGCVGTLLASQEGQAPPFVLGVALLIPLLLMLKTFVQYRVRP